MLSSLLLLLMMPIAKKNLLQTFKHFIYATTTTLVIPAGNAIKVRLAFIIDPYIFKQLEIKKLLKSDIIGNIIPCY